jgi:pyruvate dehydrogenase E2 component (dihydrolipoyllysine-residue acetyltransferase)
MTLVAQEIPKVGLVMEEVKIVRWLKNVGDRVVAGEPLLEVESEKSVVEIEAAATGRLTQILMQVDGQARVGDQVAWIDSAEAPAATAGPPSAVASPTAVPSAAPPTPAVTTAARDRDRIRSTPVARKLAAERGIDLGGVTGTGPGGRVQLEDVQRAGTAPRPTGT